jgi:threonine dehydratase
VRGILAYIVVPKNVPICKLNNMKRYGGVMMMCEPTYEERERTATQVGEEMGATLKLSSSSSDSILSTFFHKIIAHEEVI